MNKYHRCMQELEAVGHTSMKCFGNSMLPLLTSGSTAYFERQDSYRIGDIVFCKVKGRFIDAHKITAVGNDGRYLISNNHGHDNGWTRTIYGRVVRANLANGSVAMF